MSIEQGEMNFEQDAESIYRTYDETNMEHREAIRLAAMTSAQHAALAMESQHGIPDDRRAEAYSGFYVGFLAEHLTEMFGDMDQDAAEYLAEQLLEEHLADAEQDAEQDE